MQSRSRRSLDELAATLGVDREDVRRRIEALRRNRRRRGLHLVDDVELAAIHRAAGELPTAEG